MDLLFGRRKTPAEMLRQHQRTLQKAQRELDRERVKLEAQEKKLISDIKKSAKANQLSACKVMAKDLVRTRRYVQKFYQMKTQLQAVGLRIQVQPGTIFFRNCTLGLFAYRNITRISTATSPTLFFPPQTLRSNQQMAEAMKGATKAMASMNRTMNLPAIQNIMMEFEKESEIMDMKEEMMNDVIDDVMEEEDDAEETEEILNKVLDEIGIDLNQELVDAPTGNIKQAQAAATERIPQAEGMSDDAALQARLDNLRRE
ncbi:vacuolar sorting protein DID4 [Endogone sp. FLAS-F59071]|nr:vacuolar sorting protein DID4 [Endogone sp. FLAS-F59071]|eukprot:RUS22314.1 vacuolar sorting protein DID4 [Endogone sp. FLAS-F59071]